MFVVKHLKQNYSDFFQFSFEKKQYACGCSKYLRCTWLFVCKKLFQTLKLSTPTIFIFFSNEFWSMFASIFCNWHFHEIRNLVLILLRRRIFPLKLKLYVNQLELHAKLQHSLKKTHSNELRAVIELAINL